jgi:hypothetical protein
MASKNTDYDSEDDFVITSTSKETLSEKSESKGGKNSYIERM